jgi:hypothetical protein
VSERTRDGISLDFENHEAIIEKDFVDCFKDKCGNMCAEILHLVCDLWSMDSSWNDKLILSEEVVVSTDPIT